MHSSNFKVFNIKVSHLKHRLCGVVHKVFYKYNSFVHIALHIIVMTSVGKMSAIFIVSISFALFALTVSGSAGQKGQLWCKFDWNSNELGLCVDST